MKLSSSRCRVARLHCAGRQAPHSPWLGTDVLRGLEVCKLRGRLLNIINNKNKLLLEVWGACGQPEGEGLGLPGCWSCAWIPPWCPRCPWHPAHCAWCNGAAGGKKLQKGLSLEPGAPGCCAGLLPVPDCPRAASEAGAAVCPCCPGEVG